MPHNVTWCLNVKTSHSHQLLKKYSFKGQVLCRLSQHLVVGTAFFSPWDVGITTVVPGWEFTDFNPETVKVQQYIPKSWWCVALRVISRWWECSHAFAGLAALAFLASKLQTVLSKTSWWVVTVHSGEGTNCFLLYTGSEVSDWLRMGCLSSGLLCLSSSYLRSVKAVLIQVSESCSLAHLWTVMRVEWSWWYQPLTLTISALKSPLHHPPCSFIPGLLSSANVGTRYSVPSAKLDNGE